jgi:predicted TPR repeat methyltransferase
MSSSERVDTGTEPPPPLKEVSLDEAMAIAVLFQKNGQLTEAEAVYRKILDVAPDHVDALHFQGVLAHQQGKSDEAISLIEKSLELVPDRAECYNNLGIIFRAQGRLDDAVQAYLRAIALDPAHANAHNNLGVIYRACGKPVEAEAEYRTAIQLNPTYVEAYHNLGILLASQKRTQEAMACHCKVTTLCPGHPGARRLLALAHCTLGQPEKAAEIFRQWLEEEPDNPVARHMLAACSGEQVPARCSDAYIETAFDDFAGTFDAKLAHLSYRAPQIVAAILADAGPEPSKALDILDAGCGTGLCGPLLAPYARHLIGVDLSAGMLARAQERNVYDELVKGELTTYLLASHERFDVVVSADTLIYFGTVDQAVFAAADALRPGGWLIFTVEEAVDSEGDADYRIGHHGRYAHRRSYIERVLNAARLQWYIVRAELRMESGVPVAGLVVRAMKPLGERHA